MIPSDKKERAVNNVAEKVNKLLKDEYRDMRRQEVSKEDAREMITRGGSRGVDKANQETKADPA